MSRYQYKPDISVRYSPRVSRRFRARIGRLCRRHEMPEADVLRYGFEAAVLGTRGHKSQVSGQLRMRSADPRALDAMVTVRTGRKIQRIVERLWRENPNSLKVDVLRVLLERGITIAERQGMSAVMKIREENLKR